MIDKVGKKVLGLLKSEPAMNKQEVAAKLGCSLSTVYRRMRALEAEGYLVFGGGRVKLKERQKFVTWGGNRQKIVTVPEPALRLLPYLADDPRVSKRLLAVQLGCSQAAVYENLHVLAEAGYLEVGRKIVTLKGVARTILETSGRQKIVNPNVAALSIYEVYRDKDADKEKEMFSSPDNVWVLIGGNKRATKGPIGETLDGTRLCKQGGIRVTDGRGQSDTFRVVSRYCELRRGGKVGNLSKAEVGRLCGQVKQLLSRGFTREELEEAIVRLDRDSWYRDKQWGFKAVEKDVLHTRMLRARQVSTIQPLPDPMDKLIKEESGHEVYC